MQPNLDFSRKFTKIDLLLQTYLETVLYPTVHYSIPGITFNRLSVGYHDLGTRKSCLLCLSVFISFRHDAIANYDRFSILCSFVKALEMLIHEQLYCKVKIFSINLYVLYTDFFKDLQQNRSGYLKN